MGGRYTINGNAGAHSTKKHKINPMNSETFQAQLFIQTPTKAHFPINIHTDPPSH